MLIDKIFQKLIKSPVLLRLLESRQNEDEAIPVVMVKPAGREYRSGLRKTNRCATTFIITFLIGCY